MTRSAGISGLASLGSPPILASASRIAARSATQGTPVKSCMQHASGTELNFARLPVRFPACDVLDIGSLDRAIVFKPQQIFEQNSNRARDSVRVRDPGLVEGFEAIERVTIVSNLQRGSSAETVLGAHDYSFIVADRQCDIWIVWLLNTDFEAGCACVRGPEAGWLQGG